MSIFTVKIGTSHNDVIKTTADIAGMLRNIAARIEVHDQPLSGYLHTLNGQLIASYYCENDDGTQNKNR